MNHEVAQPIHFIFVTFVLSKPNCPAPNSWNQLQTNSIIPNVFVTLWALSFRANMNKTTASRSRNREWKTITWTVLQYTTNKYRHTHLKRNKKFANYVSYPDEDREQKQKQTQKLDLPHPKFYWARDSQLATSLTQTHVEYLYCYFLKNQEDTVTRTTVKHFSVGSQRTETTWNFSW